MEGATDYAMNEVSLCFKDYLAVTILLFAWEDDQSILFTNSTKV